MIGKDLVTVERTSKQRQELERGLREWLTEHHSTYCPRFYASSIRVKAGANTLRGEQPIFVFSLVFGMGERALVQKWNMRADLEIDRMKVLLTECCQSFHNSVEERKKNASQAAPTQDRKV